MIIRKSSNSAQARVHDVLFIGKRYYTNRDALLESYGRIYQLPSHWAQSGIATTLWLIDYHGKSTIYKQDKSLISVSTPIRRPAWCGHWLKQAASLFKRQRPHTIVASGDCYIGLLTWILARILRARFIFDVYDKYDEFAAYRKPFGFDLFRFLLQHADSRLFASSALMSQLGEKDGNNILVQNGINTDVFKALNMLECRRKLNFSNDAIFIGYFGSMEPDRGVADLINAIQLLRKDNLAIELLIGGKAHPDLELSCPGVRYVGNVPFEEITYMLGACNVLAIPYRRSAIMDAGASNKIIEALACQRPIVATRTPNLLANFKEVALQLEKCLAEPGDTSQIANAIRAQLSNPVIPKLPNGWDWESIAHKTAIDLRLGS